MEIDRLRLELAASYRRMETYENSDASSSTGSLYNAERAAFRKKMEKEDVQEDGPEPNDEDKARKGPPVGTPAHRTATRQKGQSRCTCANARGCGRGCISELPSKVKMVVCVHVVWENFLIQARIWHILRTFLTFLGTT